MRTTIVALFAVVSLLGGCSDSHLTEVEAVAVQSDSEVSITETTATGPTADTKNSGVLEEKSEMPEQQGALTSMNIEEGVRREYQNGPSPEEVEKYRRLVEKKSAPRKTYQPEQTNDPVFDSEMVQVGQ